MWAHVIRAELGLAIAVLLAACGSDGPSGPATCEELATIVGDCGGSRTEDDFRAEFCDLFVLSSSCLRAAGNAPCFEHERDMPSYQDVCFPSCDTDESECLGDDTIRQCFGGIEATLRCDGQCESLGLNYNGTCADTFDGMPTESGQDECWCE